MRPCDNGRRRAGGVRGSPAVRKTVVWRLSDGRVKRRGRGREQPWAAFIAAGRCRDERIGARARRQTRARASERGRAERHAIERKANPMRVRT